MTAGQGLMNIGRISVNPTITTLEIVPDNLMCDGYAYFIVDVNRADLQLPRPTGNVRIINIDTGNTLASNSLVDGYVVINSQLSNGAYNFAVLYNGVINSFAPSQSDVIQYNVSFIPTNARIEGPSPFRTSDAVNYEATVDANIPGPSINISNGIMLFMANDGYQSIILDIVDVINNFATTTIVGGTLSVGNWEISAQYISDGRCYASSDTSIKDAEVTSG